MMKKTTMHFKNLIGTNYEVGQTIGRWVQASPELLQRAMLPPGAYPAQKLKEISGLLDLYCEGINEEIQGFADTLKITPEQVIFYAMTYMERGCSLMAVQAGHSATGHSLMARNYDFSDEMEEMCFAYTGITGKYRHISSTLNLFGRCDGMNEHGLAACIASNGPPVGNFEGARKAGVTGFSFWIVIRSILENCRNVEEAIAWTAGAPIAFNLNLMLTDHDDRIALLQCIDGRKAHRIVHRGEFTPYLQATNHIVLDELKPYEKILLENSVMRSTLIENSLDRRDKITTETIKDLLSISYPDGLCCHYYNDFFGTLRSMIFDPAAKTVETAFGSPQVNPWRTYHVEPLTEETITILLPQEPADPSFFNTVL